MQVRASGLAGVAVCDMEYPPRVAFTLLTKVLEDFSTTHPDATWRSSQTELPFPQLDDAIAKYQDPHEADAIMKIQKDLDETKIILHKTIDSVLERGVKLDNLVEKSTDLSAQSKMYVFLFFIHILLPSQSHFRHVVAVSTACRYYGPTCSNKNTGCVFAYRPRAARPLHRFYKVC